MSKKKNKKARGIDPKNVHRSSQFENHIAIDAMSRRMFLKSSAGVLAIPFLSSVLSKNALALDQTIPQRYVQILSPNGGLQLANWAGPSLPNQEVDYLGRTAHRQKLSTMLNGSGDLSPTLPAAFSGLWDSMSVLLGADMPWYIGHNRIINNGAIAARRPGSAWPTDSIDFKDIGLDVEFPSIDQVIANFGQTGIYHQGLGGRRRIVHVNADGTNSFGRAIYSDPNSPIVSQAGVYDPAGLFSYLFGSGQRLPNSALRSLVDYFWPSGRSLMNSLGAEDRKALDEIFSLLSEAQKNFSEASAVSCTAEAPANTTNGYTSDSRSLACLADIITIAMKCDMSRIFVLSLGNTVAQQGDWHNASHTTSESKLAQNVRDAAQSLLVSQHRQIAEFFIARLGQALQNNRESDGSTTLDNTLIYWMHENKAPHDNVNTPAFMLGKAGGRLNAGYMVDVRDRSDARGIRDAVGDLQHAGDLMPRLWATILYAMGVPRTEYEVYRGGKGSLINLEKGYGHIVKNDYGWYSYNVTDTYYAKSLARIGEPIEMLTVDGVTWGNAVIKNSV